MRRGASPGAHPPAVALMFAYEKRDLRNQIRQASSTRRQAAAPARGLALLVSVRSPFSLVTGTFPSYNLIQSRTSPCVTRRDDTTKPSLPPYFSPRHGRSLGCGWSQEPRD